jgi:hypothetical protein
MGRTDKGRTRHPNCTYRLRRRNLLLTTKSTLPVDPAEGRKEHWDHASPSDQLLRPLCMDL